RLVRLVPQGRRRRVRGPGTRHRLLQPRLRGAGPLRQRVWAGLPRREPVVIAPAGRGALAGFDPRRRPLPGSLWAGRFEEGGTMMLSMGQRLTLLRIDDCMAMTHRYELEVRSVLTATRVGYEGRKERIAAVRQRGKRKEFYLDLADDD